MEVSRHRPLSALTTEGALDAVGVTAARKRANRLISRRRFEFCQGDQRQGHHVCLRTFSLPFPPLGIPHPNVSSAKCRPHDAAVDAAMAPNPGYGPTLLVESDGDIYRLFI